jgi:hypothetical protein
VPNATRVGIRSQATIAGAVWPGCAAPPRLAQPFGDSVGRVRRGAADGEAKARAAEAGEDAVAHPSAHSVESVSAIDPARQGFR